MAWSRDPNSGFDSLTSEERRNILSFGKLADKMNPKAKPFDIASTTNLFDWLKNPEKNLKQLNDADLEAPTAPGAFDYLKSKDGPDLKLDIHVPHNARQDARQDDRRNTPQSEPNIAANAVPLDKQRKAEKPEQKSVAPQAQQLAAARPAGRVHHIFALAAHLDTHAKPAPAAGAKPKEFNFDKAVNNLGEQTPEAQRARRIVKDRDINAHGGQNDDDVKKKAFERDLDAMREQNEEAERRHQEYINDMIEYIDDRMEITQEEMRQIQLGMDEIRRQNQHEQDIQDRVTEDIKILKPKLDASDQALADLDAQLAEQKILLAKAEEETKRINEDAGKLEERIEELIEETNDLERKEHEAEKQTSIHDLLASYSNIEIKANLEAIEKLENNIQLSKNKIQIAEEKPFIDENGNQIHKDEKGYYLLDETGTKQHYKEEKQDELRKKAEKEGLMSPEEIAKEKEFIAKQRYLIESQKQSALQSQQEGSQHEENRATSGRDKLFYKIRREDLLGEIKSSKENLDSLYEKRDELGDKVTQLKQEIKILEAQRDQEGQNNKLIREQLAQKNQELLDSQRRMNENNKKLKEEADKLEEKNKDFQKMRDLRDEYKKLGEAKTDAEKQAIQKKIQEIRDDMSPEDKRRFEQYDKKALEKRDSLISEYKASQTNQPVKQAVESNRAANTSAPQLQEAPRSVGTMSAAYLDNGQIKSNVQALSQFSVAALGEIPTNTQEMPSTNLVTNRTPAVSPGGARP